VGFYPLGRHLWSVWASNFPLGAFFNGAAFVAAFSTLQLPFSRIASIATRTVRTPVSGIRFVGKRVFAEWRLRTRILYDSD